MTTPPAGFGAPLLYDRLVAMRQFAEASFDQKGSRYMNRESYIKEMETGFLLALAQQGNTIAELELMARCASDKVN